MRLPSPLLALSLLLGACVDPRVAEDHSGLGTSEIGSYFSQHDIDEGRDVDADIRSMVVGRLRRSGGVLSSIDQQQLGLTCDLGSRSVHCIYQGVDRVRDTPRLFEHPTSRHANETTVRVAVILLPPDDAQAHVTVVGRTVVITNAR